jgi:hypothetical protein
MKTKPDTLWSFPENDWPLKWPAQLPGNARVTEATSLEIHQETVGAIKRMAAHQNIGGDSAGHGAASVGRTSSCFTQGAFATRPQRRPPPPNPPPPWKPPPPPPRNPPTAPPRKPLLCTTAPPCQPLPPRQPYPPRQPPRQPQPPQPYE